MKLLLDSSPKRINVLMQSYTFIGGQLLTPLTNYAVADDIPLAIDNGAFSSFDAAAFRRLVNKVRPYKDRLLFMALPDVVGSARRTLEVFNHWSGEMEGLPLALVLQDGIEDLEIPWRSLSAVFLGGSTEFKLSQSAAHCMKAARCCGVHRHVGRLNTAKRWAKFEDIADTCDGTGLVRFSWMRDAINNRDNEMPLFA